MKTPKAFGGTYGVLNIAMVFIVFLYVGMGFFGYLKFGDDIQGSITLNLPAAEMYVLKSQRLVAPINRMVVILHFPV